MKKRFCLAVSFTAIVLMMAACGKKDTSGLVYLKDFNPSDYVTLGDYRNMEIHLEDPAVTDEEVEQSVEYILNTRPVKTEVTGRPAQLGDVANIDFEGKLDGVAFAGGTGTVYDLELGTGRFIAGIDVGAVGMDIGVIKDLDLNFLDRYERNQYFSGASGVLMVT